MKMEVREETIRNGSDAFPTGEPQIASCSVLVCPLAVRSGLPILTATTTLEGVQHIHPTVECDKDAALVNDIQSYLRCLTTKRPVPVRLQQAWDLFFPRYQPFVRRIIDSFSHCPVSVVEREDINQEVWKEIVAKLPKLAYDPRRGCLASWLTVLTRRKVRRLERCRARSSTPHFYAIDAVEDFLPSAELGPEELLLMREISDQMEDALDGLRARTSTKNFELFCRRFIAGQSAGEIAAALGLTPDEVRYRYYRVKRKWRKLTIDMPFCEGANGRGNSCSRFVIRKPR